MGEYTATDPELVRVKTVDSDGRIYLGRDYADRSFRIILEEVDRDD